jgi:hypothetical protein
MDIEPQLAIYVSREVNNKLEADEILTLYIDAGFPSEAASVVSKVMTFVIKCCRTCFCMYCCDIRRKFNVISRYEPSAVFSVEYLKYRKVHEEFKHLMNSREPFRKIVNYFFRHKKDLSDPNPDIENVCKELVKSISEGTICRQIRTELPEGSSFFSPQYTYLMMCDVAPELSRKIGDLFMFVSKDEPKTTPITMSTTGIKAIGIKPDAQTFKTPNFTHHYWSGISDKNIAKLENIYGRGPLFENGHIVSKEERRAWERIVLEDFAARQNGC